MRYYIYLIIACCITGTCGFIIYGWFNNWIIIAYQPYYEVTPRARTINTEHVNITYAIQPHGTYKEEERSIITSSHEHERAYRIIQQWLSVMDESHVLDRPCNVQSVVPSPTHHILYVSFDQIPFNAHDATYTKWRIIESMLQSLRDNNITTANIHLLVHHQPINDTHLDFTRPWPLTGFEEYDIQEIDASPPDMPNKNRLTIMLHPAGDAQSPGRVIGTSFERGITLQCCQYIQQKIEKACPHARVVLTRFPGEQTEPLQAAAFTNRVGADLCISVHAYPVINTPPRSFIYYFIYHPETDFWHTCHNELRLLPYNQAHVTHASQNRDIAAYFASSLHEKLQTHMAIGPIVGIPFKPLIGVHAPSIALEVGLHDESDWHIYCNAWITSIYELIKLYT